MACDEAEKRMDRRDRLHAISVTAHKAASASMLSVEQMMEAMESILAASKKPPTLDPVTPPVR